MENTILHISALYIALYHCINKKKKISYMEQNRNRQVITKKEM